MNKNVNRTLAVDTLRVYFFFFYFSLLESMLSVRDTLSRLSSNAVNRINFNMCRREECVA